VAYSTVVYTVKVTIYHRYRVWQSNRYTKCSELQII